MVPRKQDSLQVTGTGRRISPLIAFVLLLTGVLFGYAIGIFQMSKILNIEIFNPVQVKQLDNPISFGQTSTTVPPVPGVGPSVGKADAPITVVEFTDYECPLCTRFFENDYAKINTNYIKTGKVRFEIRNFPLTTIHPQAQIGAEAALCAFKQDKFWQMYAGLLGDSKWSQTSESVSLLKELARTLKLDSVSFDKCLDDHETQPEIQKDMEDARAAGISGTPTFWIFGPDKQVQQINGAYPYAVFSQAFDDFLKK